MENIFNNLRKFQQKRGIVPAGDTLDNYLKMLALNSVWLEYGKNALGEAIAVIVVSEDSEFLTKAGEFRKLLTYFNKRKQSLVKDSDDAPITNLIFISDVGFKNAIQNQFNSIISEYYPDFTSLKIHVEDLKYSHFKIDVTTGIYCSPHRILNRAETEQLLYDLKCDRGNLPHILSTDPQVIWIGARKGDVVEITRVSEVTGTSIGYRYVVDTGKK